MFHIEGNILWLRTVTLTFPVCELSALDWNKKCCLPVVPLLCGIFRWNFTDMFHIKGYILWQRTITLTFPVHELSALDWSEKWFLTCSSFTTWNIWMKLHRYVEQQRLHITTKDLHSYLSSSWVIHPWLIWKMFLTCSSFTIWNIWMKLHRYVDHQRLHIVTKDVISLSISVLLLFRHYISHKITFGAPSSGGVLCSACGAFITHVRSFYLTYPYQPIEKIKNKQPHACRMLVMHWSMMSL